MFTEFEVGMLGCETPRDNLKQYREELRAAARATYEANIPHCVFCCDVLPYEKRRSRFCSHSCSANFTNGGTTRNPKRRDRRTHCLKCNSQICGSGLLYCSTRCSHAHKSEKFEAKFLGNMLEVGSHSSRAIRKFLAKTHGEQCQECGWAEKHTVTGCVPLEVHHVDGNSASNCKENVRLLCPNCHSLTLTFRKLNRGNGRADRRNTPK